jgi:hypothetical protein
VLRDVEYLLLLVKFLFSGLACHKQVAVVRVLVDSHLTESQLERLQIFHMFGHVCGQDNPRESHVENLFFLQRHIGHEVAFFLAHDRESLGSVIIFLHSQVVVANSAVTHGVDVIGIIETIVVEIVASTSHYCGHLIDVVQVGHFDQVSLRELQEHHLHYISTVQVVVVVDLLLVALLDLLKEGSQLGFVVFELERGSTWQLP